MARLVQQRGQGNGYGHGRSLARGRFQLHRPAQFPRSLLHAVQPPTVPWRHRIESATIVAAEALRIDDTLGSITTGKTADCILLNTNPLDDISILQDPFEIDCVFKEGVKVVDKGRIIHTV